MEWTKWGSMSESISKSYTYIKIHSDDLDLHGFFTSSSSVKMQFQHLVNTPDCDFFKSYFNEIISNRRAICNVEWSNYACVNTRYAMSIIKSTCTN